MLKKSNRLLVGLNLLFFGVIAILLYILNNKPQAPAALIAPHITMREITLKVSNIQDMKNFYSQLLGMQNISEDTKQVTLGYNHQAVLQLLNTPQLPMAGQSDPGLDQIAIVFTSRPGLARAVQRVLRTNPSLYLGGTDRGAVGEAFYVTDPQGNTLELYYDTDPSTWPRSIKGNVEGNALPIDVNSYVAKYAPLQGDNGMHVGHIQMRIGNLSQGKNFYLNTIGFYAVPSLLGGNSLFMSDGYYHHDVVINQTQGYDGDKINNYLGLYGFSFSVPNSSYLKKLEDRLTHAHVPYSAVGNGITFSDPWGISITVTASSPW